jgi:glycosyltransferase involved in cell wall biosynthesis
MYQNRSIAVVVPAYREETRIGNVIRELPAWIDFIVVVDDASGDGTYAAIMGIPDARITALKHEENQGVGGATITGFQKACELGADIVVKMDGDGQMDPAGLPAMLEPIVLREADFTKGNRFLHTRELTRMPLVRRIGNVGLSFMAKIASGYWSNFDPTNGYLAMHRTVWSMLDHARLKRRFFFENSLLLELGLSRAVARDVYMPARYGDKVSHLSERQVLVEFPSLLLRGFLRRVMLQYLVRDFSAVSLFLFSGTVASAFGLVWGLLQWWHYATLGVATPTGTVMIAVLPLVLGLQLLLQALVMDIQNVPREPIQRGSSPAGT